MRESKWKSPEGLPLNIAVTLVRKLARKREGFWKRVSAVIELWIGGRSE